MTGSVHFEGSVGGNLREQALGAELAEVDRDTGFQCRPRLIAVPTP